MATFYINLKEYKVLKCQVWKEFAIGCKIWLPTPIITEADNSFLRACPDLWLFITMLEYLLSAYVKNTLISRTKRMETNMLHIYHSGYRSDQAERSMAAIMYKTNLVYGQSELKIPMAAAVRG